MGHLDIYSRSYGKKKGQESNWQFDSRPLKVKNRLDPSACSQNATHHWKTQGELQVCFRPHPNRRSKQRVVIVQSFENPNQDSFGTFPCESRDKKPFGCGCRGEAQSILYGGRWWLPLSPGHDESCESKVARGLSQHQGCSKK